MFITIIRSLTFLIFMAQINLSYSNDCLKAHLSKSLRKSNQVFRINDSNEDYRWNGWGIRVVGGSFILIGGLVSSAGALPFILIGTGASYITKSIIASIQEPRYQLLANIILYAGTNQEEHLIHRDSVFQNFIQDSGQISYDQDSKNLVKYIYQNMENSNFCTKSGKPFSFKKIKKYVFKNFSNS